MLSIHALAPRRTLRELLERPWFSRVWVIQEAVLGATSSLVLCGKSSIAFPSLLRSAHALNAIFGSLPGDHRGATDLLTIIAHRIINESEEPSLNIAEELMLYLRWFAPFNCSEQHDRFYGILGLLQHTSLPIVLAPNYQKKPEVVFREYTLYILKETKFFNILSARSWPNHSEWPSWVPNWKGSFSLHFGLGKKCIPGSIRR
jgi:hypothetical protein